MSYHLTIGVQPWGKKYQFVLNTEADQIPLTKEELEALKKECEEALAQLEMTQ